MTKRAQRIYARCAGMQWDVYTKALMQAVCALLFTLYGASFSMFGQAVAAVPDVPSRTPLPVPAGLALSPRAVPEAILAAFLNLPYREDGAVDEEGHYTLFAAPNNRFSSPGLNCSGFVLAAMRFLLGENITLETAKRDRLGDSGPASPHGEDWDFGWDVLLNVSDGAGRTLRNGAGRALLLPGGKTLAPEKATGFAPRGFDLHAAQTRQELLGRLRPGHVYLLSFNKDVTRPGYSMQHYHVGLLLPTADGRAWLYQTTGRARKVNRRDLNSESGWASFTRSFANSGKVRKHVLVLEVALSSSEGALPPQTPLAGD